MQSSAINSFYNRYIGLYKQVKSINNKNYEQKR
jgi:hypothetical protein